MPTTLKSGDAAPTFELETDRGEHVSLENLKGQWVVLYWYPKDDTAGCTTEACEIRDNFGLISGEAAVFGVSPDSVKSHARFRDKFSLPFTLLADADHRVADAYGLWGPKKFMGREYMGVIAPDGRIAHVFEKVKPAGHAIEILETLCELKKN
jgi:peroxiredoxin Q/BCP